MLSQFIWLKLPVKVRYQLASDLKLVRTMPTHVIDNVVVSDGFSPQVLAGITVQQLQEYTGSQEADFYKLFDIAVAKAQRLVPPEPQPVAEEEWDEPLKVVNEDKETMTIEIKKKRGRPSKNV